MMSAVTQSSEQQSGKGIAFVLFGVTCISVNDMLIKQLSGDYPLHQMVFTRSIIGIFFTLFMVKFEGGFAVLRTGHLLLHILRALLVVFANLTFFAALAVMPLADATAMFFVAPLFITLLSIPLLREKVGLRRISAVLVGLLGVVIMFRPGVGAGVSIWIMVLPVVAAFTYAFFQIMTRWLGGSSKASAMAFYVQMTFIVVSLGFWVVAGDGRFAEGQDNPVLIFLLRAWVWPTAQDWPFFILMGLMATMIGYSLSQAYRLASAATIAPFEYIALPLSIFWGWLIFATLPDIFVWTGVILIIGSGLYVVLREQQKKRPLVSRRRLRRW